MSGKISGRNKKKREITRDKTHQGLRALEVQDKLKHYNHFLKEELDEIQQCPPTSQ